MGTNTSIGFPAAGAALGIVIVAIVEAVAHTDISVTVEGAITVLCTLAAGYILPPTGVGRSVFRRDNH